MGGDTVSRPNSGASSQDNGDPLDHGTAHFEDALDFCRKVGYRPELAWTCCDYADALVVGEPRFYRGRATLPDPPCQGRVLGRLIPVCFL